MTTILGTGSYLPRTTVENDAFEAERFRLRTGSVRRHHAADDETSIFMATESSKAALEAAGMSGDDIDVVLGFSGMPDFLYPKDTNKLIETLGATGAAAWSLDTACSTSISALGAAHAVLQSGMFETALVTTTMSWVGRGIDREQTDYSSLGDGAAAIVVQRSDSGGYIGSVERTDPGAFDFVQLKNPYAAEGEQSFEFSSDPRYRKYFGVTVLDVVRELFEKTGTGPDDVDWFLPHQVGTTLLHVWSEQLGLDSSKLLETFSETGNMSAVNIPYILDTHIRGGKIERGDKLLLFAPGAGTHLAAMLWEY